MKILALETSGAYCSAALMIDDQIEQRLEHAPRQHGDLILSMLQGLLEQAGLALRQLDAIAYGRGPGSFTGVRIAAAVAQGIAFGAGKPVVGVSTLQATAAAAMQETGQRRIACALDARMGEVYWGLFDGGRAMETHEQQDGAAATAMVAIGAEQVVAPEATPMLGSALQSDQPSGNPSQTARWCAAGDGWSLYPELRERHTAQIGTWATTIRAQARDLLWLAQAQVVIGAAKPAREALPVYLRNRVTFAAAVSGSLPSRTEASNSRHRPAD